MKFNNNYKYNFYGLYVITENDKTCENLLENIKEVILGGAKIIQYRDKNASFDEKLAKAQKLQKLCHRLNIPLIINDDIKIAKKINSAGIHLGKNDLSIKDARLILGEKKIIGISCYNDLQLAILAQENGADYVAFGSFFSSQTKPNAVTANLELLKKAKQILSIPIVAIGGINHQNCQTLIKNGADMIAVINAVFTNGDIKKNCENFCNKFNN